MKYILYSFLFFVTISSCYKDNGEPLRKFTEFSLGTSYDTIPCKTATVRNEATFGDGSSQRFTTSDNGSYFLTDRIFSSNPYQFEGDFFLDPDRSAFYWTTRDQYDAKHMRLFVKKRYPNRTYICEPGKKMYVELDDLGRGKAFYFCGGTFFNVTDATDSVVVSYAQFYYN